MLYLFFVLLMLAVFGRLFIFAVKATWGIARVLCTFILFPFVLIFLILGGMLKIAFPLLIIAGIISFLDN